MSLSAREQQALDSIRDDLTRSDPSLAARLDIFTRLACGEEMPPRDRVRVGSRRSRPRRRRGRAGARGPARSVYQRLGLSQALLCVWLVVTAAMIMVSLVNNRGGSQQACTASWARSCTDRASAPASALGPRRSRSMVLRARSASQTLSTERAWSQLIHRGQPSWEGSHRDASIRAPSPAHRVSSAAA